MQRMNLMLYMAVACLATVAGATHAQNDSKTTGSTGKPNIVYIMSDDHAAHAVSAYGSKINKTPNIDRIAEQGMLLENCFATNALCAPSRATILTSKYGHINGVIQHRGNPPFDGSQMTYPKLLQEAGYQTAIVGKWHLQSDPTGFDYWNILPGQGAYYNPVFFENGERKKHDGYTTDLIGDFSIEWLEKRDKSKPFLLVSQHKAPHRPWGPSDKYSTLFEDEEIPEPPTFNDDYTSRSSAATEAELRMRDLKYTDVKSTPPAELTGEALDKWKYQRYIKDYLRTVQSVDDNVGRLYDYLEKEGVLDNTVFIYTSDQGFFLGDHNWFDKRFMYEESIRMPFLVRYPSAIKAGTRSEAMVTNLDFAPTLLDFAGVDAPDEMQGVSFRKVLEGETPEDWQTSFYYHYHEYPDADHLVAKHYGIRNERYKLIRFYHPMDEWEFFDLEKDPNEMNSAYDVAEYQDTISAMKKELKAMREKYKDDVGPAVE